MSLSTSGLLPEAHVNALATLPGVGPAGLRRMLATTDPAAAWAGVLAGHPFDTDRRWMAAAQRIDVAALWRATRKYGIRVVLPGSDGYPRVLKDDPAPPPVLFSLGELSCIDDRPRVGVVGTRTCTRYGLGVAAQIGAELAGSGVSVVSGLALGIDGAAHEGAVAGWDAHGPASAPPIAVVAGGLDRPYPASAARLWERVAMAGAIVSESPIGTPVERWRFPKRNRLLAALSDVLIVVESHQLGGSLHTARAAIDRGVPVGAVPGSIRSPASAGSNDLLADGCFPVRDSTDVIVALELVRAGDVPVRARRRRTPRHDQTSDDTSAMGAIAGAWASESREPIVVGPTGPDHADTLDRDDAVARTDRHATALSPTRDEEGARDPGGKDSVLTAMGWERCSIEQLLRRTGRPLSEVSVEIERLAAAGAIHGDGSWWERA